MASSQKRVASRRRSRLPNPRLAKIHRSYTVEEVAKLYGVHRNTVRHWIKEDGLPISDQLRPMLILGRDLVAFAKARRAKRKCTCQPDEMYCLRCRQPRKPAGDMADYTPIHSTGGNLVGICPVCAAIMNRRVSLTQLERFWRHREVTVLDAPLRIGKSANPCVNSDFAKEPQT